jgi:2-amino-4-hydroxy-6-hydroxymethyldihydropteridine diphosphokinase
MTRAVLSIGSNLGDRIGYLQSVVTVLSPYLVRVSPIYESPPWGPVEQGDYYNAILIVDDPAATPVDWLSRGRDCERAAGRTRQVHWGPRTLDVDVISVDDVVSEDPVLTLPHPRAAERAFVLLPWLAIDSEAELPGQGSVAVLLDALPAEEVGQIKRVPGVALRA